MDMWIPYRQITAPKTDDPGGPEEMRFTRRFSGLGDVIAMAFFRVKEADTPHAVSFTTGLGVRLPTGASQPDHDWGTGISRDPVLQTGAGTLDPILSAIASIPFGRNTLFGNTVARFSTSENIHQYKFSHEFQAGLGLARPLNEWMSFSIAANGIFTGYDYDQGSRVDNTGGKWIYLTPGFTLRSELISTTISMQIPVHQNVNESQLVSDYVFTLGFSCGLDTRRKSEGRDTAIAIPSAHTALDIKTISLGEEVELGGHLADGKYTLFEFYGDLCHTCAQLEPELRTFVAENTDVALRKINIGMGGTPVMAQHQIEETPTLILLNKEGQQILRFAGTDLNRVRRAMDN